MENIYINILELNSTNGGVHYCSGEHLELFNIFRDLEGFEMPTSAVMHAWNFGAVLSCLEGCMVGDLIALPCQLPGDEEAPDLSFITRTDIWLLEISQMVLGDDGRLQFVIGMKPILWSSIKKDI
jgi:hypothetical protein